MVNEKVIKNIDIMVNEKVIKNIDISGKNYKGIIFDGCNLSKHFKPNEEEVVMAISRFDLPKDMMCAEIPDDFEVEARTTLNPDNDFILVFKSKQSAINVANWILNTYGEEFKQESEAKNE